LLAAPVDPEVRRIAEKLAKFVAKNGRGLENTTRQRNPGDTPFRSAHLISKRALSEKHTVVYVV
jgi:hypothetical protein